MESECREDNYFYYYYFYICLANASAVEVKQCSSTSARGSDRADPVSNLKISFDTVFDLGSSPSFQSSRSGMISGGITRIGGAAMSHTG